MAVEILTVSLSDESVERLAQRVAQLMGGNQAVTQSNYPSPEPQAAQSQPVSAPQPDPWTQQGPTPPTQTASAPPASSPAPQYPQQQYPQQQFQGGQGSAGAAGSGAPPSAPAGPVPQQAAPVCNHGPMRYVPAGFSQSTGRSYRAFWGCPAQRGDPSKCKSIPA